MEKFNLSADIRDLAEKNKKIRADRKIPAVVYGKNQEPISLVLNYSEFLKLFRKSWESSIINLSVVWKEMEVLVHQIQYEPVSGDFIHIDFYALTRGEVLTTKVSLNFVWESAAAKEGGIVEELNKEIEVKCLPKDLVSEFDVDLSILKDFGDNIKVSDLNLGENFEILTPADEVLVLVAKPKVEVVEDTAPEAPAIEGEEEAATEDKA